MSINTQADTTQTQINTLQSQIDVLQAKIKEIQINDASQNREKTEEVITVKPVANKYKYTCKNPDCKKGYEKKAIECRSMDFCSTKCCQIVISPLREAERIKEEERSAKNKYMGNLSYGGGAGSC